VNSEAAILLDLFDTLVVLDTEKLPTIDVGGRARPSTTPLLLPQLQEALPSVELAQATEALFKAYRSGGSDEEGHLKEIPSVQRFATALEYLGLPADEAAPLGRRLSDLHMEHLISIARLPEGNREALEAMASEVQVGLISNFDAARWGRRLLERLDVQRFFAIDVFSEDLGLRKPHPAVFLEATTMLGLDPRSCLMVGDDPKADIAGAGDLSIQTAWIRPPGTSYPTGVRTPDWEVEHLRELLGSPLARLLGT